MKIVISSGSGSDCGTAVTLLAPNGANKINADGAVHVFVDVIQCQERKLTDAVSLVSVAVSPTKGPTIRKSSPPRQPRLPNLWDSGILCSLLSPCSSCAAWLSALGAQGGVAVQRTRLRSLSTRRWAKGKRVHILSASPSVPSLWLCCFVLLPKNQAAEP